MPQYFDAHAHTNIAAFAADWQETCERTLAAGTWHANVGTQADTSKRAIEIAEAFSQGVYAVVGLHPVHTSKSFHDPKEIGEEAKGFTSRGEQFDYNMYRTLGAHEKVVAVGECGLDYYRVLEPEAHARQREAFVAQVMLANELQKPLMLHIRSGAGGNAYRDAAVLLREHAKVGGNVHFFAGSWEDARPFLDLGFTLSFTAVITFARDYDEVVKNVPLERLLSETDSPYVAPKLLRGQRNEPIHVRHVVEAFAAIRNQPLAEVQQAMVENVMHLFGLRK